MSAEDHQVVGLGKAVELRRIELGLKRRELAERAQLSYPYISEIENGVKEPSAKALRKIAEALQMKPADLAVLSERLEEGQAESGSILLDAAFGSAPSTAAPSGPPAADFDEPPFRASVMNMSVLPTARSVDSPEITDGVIDAVRAEFDRWGREELPRLVRAELERLRRDRDQGPSDW